MRRRVTIALLVFLAWTVLAGFFAASTSLTYISQGRAGLWSQTLAIELAQWWIWAALTPLVLSISRRFPLDGRRLPLALALHLPLGLFLAFLAVEAEGGMRMWLFRVKPYLLITNLARHVLIYWALVALAHALDRYGRSRARAAEAEARLGQAQVQLLRAQLQPHFLFNALNTIAELIHEDPERADQMVGRLSDLLRATLDAGDRPVVTVDEEFGLARHYLAIQQARFGDRLNVTIDLADDCRDRHVPHLCLQPLIENAVRHGLAPRADGGRLRIAAEQQAGHLVLTVEDDGVGWKGDAPVDGIGLMNTRSRLQSLYRGRASLALSRRPGGGTIARVMMPSADGTTGRGRPQ